MPSSIQPLVSAVVVAHARARWLARCIESLLGQTEERLEIVLVLLTPSEAVRELACRCAARDARVRPIECSPMSPSEARNVGVDEALADLLYFVDDDVEVPPHLVSEVLRLFGERPELAVVGGPNLTPPDDPPFAHLTGELLASRWGTGIARARYARARAQPAFERHLILCNLGIRRAVFDSGIRFPMHFGGEENVVMGHAEARGFQLWYTPDIWVYHHRRTTVRGYVEQVYRYGWGRAVALARAPRTFHVAYFVPVGWLLYVVALPGLAWLTPHAWWPLAAYVAAIAAASARIAWVRKQPGWLPGLMVLFPLTHGAYAAGLVLSLPRLGRLRAPGDPAAPPIPVANDEG